MVFPNPLLRRFVQRATENSFDKGILWGICTGVLVTHFYKEDKYRKLESKYFKLKHDFVNERLQNLKPGETFIEP
jgi:hypothetical protein